MSDAEGRAREIADRIAIEIRRWQDQVRNGWGEGSLEDVIAVEIAPLLEEQGRLRQERDAARIHALRLETPWPLHSVLVKLADAADHLLGSHSCDAHGYEGVMQARDAAREIAADLAPEPSPGSGEGERLHAFAWDLPVRFHVFEPAGCFAKVGAHQAGPCAAYVQAGPMTAICSRDWWSHQCKFCGARHDAPAHTTGAAGRAAGEGEPRG